MSARRPARARPATGRTGPPLAGRAGALVTAGAAAAGAARAVTRGPGGPAFRRGRHLHAGHHGRHPHERLLERGQLLRGDGEPADRGLDAVELVVHLLELGALLGDLLLHAFDLRDRRTEGL